MMFIILLLVKIKVFKTYRISLKRVRAFINYSSIRNLHSSNEIGEARFGLVSLSIIGPYL